MLQTRASRIPRILAPILASRFFTISALIHLVIVILIGGRILADRYVAPAPIEAVVDIGTPDISTKLPEEPPVAPPISQPPVGPSAPTAPAAPSGPLPLILPDTIGPSFPMPVSPVAPPSIRQNSSHPAGPGNPELPGPISSRGPDRDTIGRSFGETVASEAAVLRALRWLQTQQHSDGTWGDNQYHDAFTGLALLCFLGHGDTPRKSREFGVTVANAIDALVTEGNVNQARFTGRTDFEGNPAVYDHAICTYALSEAYTMTRDARIAPLVQAAVQRIIQGQRADGGWAYSYSLAQGTGGGFSDTSVSGWQIQALKAAHLTGLPGTDEAVRPVLAKAMRFMDSVFDEKDGSFGYRAAGDRHYELTGVGVLSKLFWLGRPDRTVRAGFKNIETKDLKYGGPDCNLYAWYYDTQAAFQAQGGHWDWWKQRFQDQLNLNQSPDGSWPATGGREIEAKWNSPEGDGPLYRTTFCCLMLEVFYRYLPTTQESALSGGVEGL